MRRGLIAGALTLLLVAAGCGTNKNAALGVGPPVNFCEGFFSYTYFDEPDPDDPTEVQNYASAMVRVIDRIRPNFKIELPKGPPLKVPPTITEDLHVVKRAMVRLRQDVRAAKGDPAKVRQLVNSIILDETLNGADGRIVDFATTKCPDQPS